MQETFLQVFVVAVGLLVYPNNDPRIEEWDDALTAGMQEHEQKLLREEEKLNQEMEHGGHTELHEQEDEADLHSAKNQDATDQNHPDFKVDIRSVLLHKLKTDNETDARVLQVDHDDRTDVKGNLQKGTEANEMAQIHTKTPPSGKAELEKDYLWFIWKTISVVSFIHFFWKCKLRNSQGKQSRKRPALLSNMPNDMPRIESSTLQLFYSQCIEVASDRKQREEEFLKGFINDLLETMTQVCSENGGMVIEKAEMEDVHNIIVPFTPPEPYFFECLYINQADDVLLDMQMCGQIKLMKNEKIQNGCPCQASDADDMVCLLHSESDKVKIKVSGAFDGLLSKKDSSLSKAEVSRWFQRTIRQAWSLISFKYNFELNIRNNIPGAMIVRFRSGEKINFSINPVIKFGTGSHFFITPCSPIILDTFWSLSLSKYENDLLNQISEHLPDNSCHVQTLEIALFLQKKQTTLTGSSALKDLHFKVALMYLVLTKDPSGWRPDLLANRLQDLFDFLMKSLETKHLHHVLIGNPLAPNVDQLPTALIQSKPVNLFHPLVVHECMYKNATMHFQEMLKNTHVLINDYLGRGLQ